VPVEQRGDTRDKALLIRAVDQQYSGVFHAAFSLNQEWTASLTASVMNPMARKRRLPHYGWPTNERRPPGRPVSQQMP
jgi:hypothetical protein